MNLWGKANVLYTTNVGIPTRENKQEYQHERATEVCGVIKLVQAKRQHAQPPEPKHLVVVTQVAEIHVHVHTWRQSSAHQSNIRRDMKPTQCSRFLRRQQIGQIGCKTQESKMKHHSWRGLGVDLAGTRCASCRMATLVYATVGLSVCFSMPPIYSTRTLSPTSPWELSR